MSLQEYETYWSISRYIFYWVIVNGTLLVITYGIVKFIRAAIERWRWNREEQDGMGDYGHWD